MQHRVKVDQKHGVFAVPSIREKTKACPVNYLTDLYMMKVLVLNGFNFRFFSRYESIF